VISLERFEESIELGRLRILCIGASVDFRGLGIRLAPNQLNLAISVGLDFVQVTLALAGNAESILYIVSK